MKTLLILLIFICSATVCLAQSAKDELENGYKLNSAEKLFLRFSEDGKMKISADERFANPLTFQDSTLFLVPNVGVNVYMRPVNPLKGTTHHDMTVINDTSTEAAENALSAMLSVINTAVELKMENAFSGDLNLANAFSEFGEEQALQALKSMIESYKPSVELIDTTALNKLLEKSPKDSLKIILNQVKTLTEIVDSNTVYVDNFKKEANSLKDTFEAINDSIQKKRQQEVEELFKQLNALDFKSKVPTVASLAAIETKLKSLNAHYAKIENMLESERSKLKKRMVPLNYLSGIVLNEMEEVKDGQYKIVKEFEELFKMVNTYAKQAAYGADGVDWVVPLGALAAEKGKISTFSIELKSGKYTFDEGKNSITEVTPSSLGKHSFKVKRFQRFVPEVVYGTAYTFIEYPVYGTTQDESGNQVVEQSGNERINNLNITGLLNFNYFLSNSAIHPLVQIGLGINNEIPTLLAGGGIRVHINNTRFAITGGMALTWVKKLSELSEGDTVSGTADIDEDLTFQFNWPPKPYVGLQFKF